MYRNITYSEKDYYCRYLDIALNRAHPMRLCGGKFGCFLEEFLGIKKLPYNINLIDLVLEGLFTSDLFVKIPKEYFITWKNYPMLKADFGSELVEDINDAGLYNINIWVGDKTDLFDFSHPYDLSLKKRFTDKYSIQTPVELKSVEHPNGIEFCPYETYFSYWRAYIIFESLIECKFIERYLCADKGIAIYKNTIKKINNHWNTKYSPIFDRLSHYITFKSQCTLSDAKIKCTYGDISKHLLQRTSSSASDLESDMVSLLELHNTWQRKYKENGLNNFESAFDLLKRDIYFLYEWLCSSGYNEKVLFNKWKYENWQGSPWSQLKDVLDFEEILFSDTFEKYVPIYSQNIPKWIAKYDISGCYKRLQVFDSFAPWMRAFSDMHTAQNRKDKVKLVQPRILDNLLVMTIRTEILIRSLYSSIADEQDPNDLKKLVRKMADFVGDEREKATLKTISSNDNWKLTELRDRPKNIFHQIEECRVDKKWTDEQKYFFHSFLKFVASRNYFAHHSYKDDELNSYISELCGKVLVACLHSVLFIDNLVKRV